MAGWLGTRAQWRADAVVSRRSGLEVGGAVKEVKWDGDAQGKRSARL
jgi:hypothetical protein